MARSGVRTAIVVYPFMPHYRYGVFHRLDCSSDIDFTFASDSSSRDGIEVIAPELVKRHRHVRNTFWRRLTWQKGVLRYAAFGSYDAYIFLGDVSIISTWAAAAVARLRGRSVFFWTIGWHRPEYALKRLVRQSFYRLANELWLYGDVARKIGEQQGFPAKKMRVIYNSHESRTSVGTSNIAVTPIEAGATVAVGAVIRLNAVKKLHLLIDAVALLGAAGRQVRIIIGGDGPERSRLVAHARREYVDVVFLGPVYSSASLAAIYERISVTVVPAAVGLTAIQSMSHGVPVISEDNAHAQMPEVESIIPGNTGDLYRPGNVADLADRILHWIDRVAADRSAVGERCKWEVADKWNAESQSEAILEALRSSRRRWG